MTEFTVQPFQISADDPLVEEHRCILAWVEDALASIGEPAYYRDAELKGFSSGQKLLEGGPEQARRYVVAAMAQTRYWDQLGEKVREQAENDHERANAHHLPGWGQVWGRRRQTEAVIRQLMRRSIAFERDDVVNLVNWC